jgi:hypothetical protein
MSTVVATVPGDKTICLPIADGVDYDQLVKDRKRFRPYLDSLLVLTYFVFCKLRVDGTTDVYKIEGC